MNKCGQCGRELPPDSPGERNDCPTCGPSSRNYARGVVESVPAPTDALSSKQARGGINSTADLDDSGNVGLSITGKPPKNEQDADEVCARLVRFLNNRGAAWGELTAGVPNSDIDYYATDIRTPAAKLQMQVVRASENEPMWATLGRDNKVDVKLGSATAADELLQVLEKKFRRYPTAQRGQLALVIDANRIPSHTFQQVFDSFRSRHLERCKSFGFEQVWVVGPRDEIVSRIDVESPVRLTALHK